jgi:hypothetical protein
MISSLFDKRLWRGAVLASAAGLWLTGGAARAAVTLAYDPGTINYTTGLTDYETTGADMAGMTVTAWFANGTMKTAAWAPTGTSSGSASVANWFSLSESNDTFLGTWTLTNLASNQALTKVVIDAGKGDAVFDVKAFPILGTPNSSYGTPFVLTGTAFNLGIDITATYRDAVALTGQSPVGDLYRRLELVFTGGLSTNSLPGNLFGLNTITFLADTDSLKLRGDLQAVPEPTTLVMAGALLGLTGVTALRRKNS